MRLRKGMIDDYLVYVTSMTFVDVDDPLEDMSVYDTAIDAMAAAAQREGNLDNLHLALDSLISDPDGRIQDFQGLGQPFTSDQMVRLFTYACERIWPGESVSGPGEAVPVDFVTISKADWDREMQR